MKYIKQIILVMIVFLTAQFSVSAIAADVEPDEIFEETNESVEDMSKESDLVQKAIPEGTMVHIKYEDFKGGTCNDVLLSEAPYYSSLEKAVAAGYPEFIVTPYSIKEKDICNVDKYSSYHPNVYLKGYQYSCFNVIDITNDGTTYTATVQIHWWNNNYTLKFSGNGVSGDMDALSYWACYDAKFIEGKTTLPVNTYVRDNHEFVCWNTKADGTGDRYEDGQNIVNFTENDRETVTLYAQWRKINCNISYKLNGGTNAADNPTTCNFYGPSITLKPATRKGYIFTGWYTDKNCTNQISSVGNGTDKDLCLYAGFRPVNYKIVYHANTDSEQTTETIVQYDQNVPVSGNTFVNDGHRFMSWNTKADGTGTKYLPDQQLKNLRSEEGAQVDLYAQWTKETDIIPVTYVLNGGKNNKENPGEYVVDPEKSIVLQKPTRTGYTFKGWYTDEACTKKITRIDCGKYDPVTVYAKWSMNTYRIKYKVNGGRNSKKNPGTYTITGKTIVFKNPTRKGYTFNGWYKDKKYKAKVTRISSGSHGSITLYAKWKANKYKITYKFGGHDSYYNEDNNPSAYTYGKNLTLKNLKTTALGYRFAGWYSNKKCTKRVKKIKKGHIGKVVLYAKWKYSYNLWEADEANLKNKIFGYDSIKEAEYDIAKKFNEYRVKERGFRPAKIFTPENLGVRSNFEYEYYYLDENGCRTQDYVSHYAVNSYFTTSDGDTRKLNHSPEGETTRFVGAQDMIRMFAHGYEYAMRNDMPWMPLSHDSGFLYFHISNWNKKKQSCYWVLA